MPRRRVAIMISVCAMALPALPALADAAGAAAPARTFANCTAMHKVYPHGVGRVGAHDKTSGTPVTTFVRNTRLYNANTKSDRDKDGIACEQK